MLRFAAFLFVLLPLTAWAQTSVPSDSRLQSIASGRVVKIAYRSDATPFSFIDPQRNEPTGYTVDVCRLIVASIEQQFGIQGLKIEWVPVSLQTRFSAVAEGKADMECGSSTITLGRMRDVDFSSIVFVESTGVVVAKASGAKSFDELAGKKIAVLANTTNERVVNEQLRARNLTASVVPYNDRSAAIAALESGQADAFASDRLLLLGAKFKTAEAFVLLADEISFEPYAIALPRGDWAFKLAVNTGFAQAYRSRQLAEVYRNWFGPIGLQPGVLQRAAFTLGNIAD